MMSKGVARFRAVRYRAIQVRHHLTVRDSDAVVPPELERLLHGLVAERFRALPPGDKLHLVEVATTLADKGGTLELITAGLIHDIGKSIPGISVSVPDRVWKVVLDGLSPSLGFRLAQRASRPRFGSGIWVLCRHANAGAEFARTAGYSERVVWLVANHERPGLGDPELDALIAVDGASFGPPSG